jgi:hypothetical protein
VVHALVDPTATFSWQQKLRDNLPMISIGEMPLKTRSAGENVGVA